MFSAGDILGGGSRKCDAAWRRGSKRRTFAWRIFMNGPIEVFLQAKIVGWAYLNTFTAIDSCFVKKRDVIRKNDIYSLIHQPKIYHIKESHIIQTTFLSQTCVIISFSFFQASCMGVAHIVNPFYKCQLFSFSHTENLSCVNCCSLVHCSFSCLHPCNVEWRAPLHPYAHLILTSFIWFSLLCWYIILFDSIPMILNNI